MDLADQTRSHSRSGNDPRSVVPTRQSRRKYSVEYKIKILAEYDTLDRDGKGMLLRREDLYTSILSEWRKQRDQGGRAALANKPGRPAVAPTERDNARLRSRVQRLEAELGRARHVIDSQATLAALLGELDNDAVDQSIST